MNEKKREINIDEDCPVSSVGEMTGLIPTSVTSEMELEAYNEMFSFVPKAVTKSRYQANDQRKNHSET